MIAEPKVLPAESCHWYGPDGSPQYSVIGKNGKERATTLRDARANDWLPSVTNILNVAAKPRLEAWKAKQILEASLTLPRIDGESLDDYAIRVVEDSKAQSQKARDKGTELHAAIEKSIQGTRGYDDPLWIDHLDALWTTTEQYGILLSQGRTEHSFASMLGYGGKIDFHNDEPMICDFKTKDRIDDKKQLAWPEQIQQLSAYGFGLWNDIPSVAPRFRALNIFIGVSDQQVRIVEYEWPDIVEAFAQFKCLLEYWQRTKKFGPYA